MNNNKLIINLFARLQIMLILILLPYKSFAVVEPQPMAIDSRLRVMAYNPNDIFKFTGFYGYESSIVFSSEETIDSVTMGDSIAWQVVPNGNRLFLKPIEPEATTNMTLITNKRVYHFELHAEYAKNINDPSLIFSVKFLYPDEEGSNGAVQHFADQSEMNVIEEGKNLNYKYTISGPDSIAPLKIFDDGEKTYIEFNKNTQELPSIFVVYNDNTEGILNYSVSGKYIIVQRIASRFTLRRGSEIGCIFNEKLLH